MVGVIKIKLENITNLKPVEINTELMRVYLLYRVTLKVRRLFIKISLLPT